MIFNTFNLKNNKTLTVRDKTRGDMLTKKLLYIFLKRFSFYLTALIYFKMVDKIHSRTARRREKSALKCFPV